MRTLYSHRSGASDFEVHNERYSPEEWVRLRGHLLKLLAKRNQDGAIALLERFPWVVMDATNFFQDEFGVLYARLSIDAYAEHADLPSSAQARRAAEALADAIYEIQPGRSYIRHVAFVLDTDGEEFVSPPVPAFTSDTVQRALAEADRLLNAGQAVSAIDRTHTAFVGYLRLACNESGVEFAETDTMAAVMRKLTSAHKAFTDQPHAEQIGHVLRASAAILGAFDPIRNRGSIAHANDELLNEPEARLVVNIARSLFHYLDARLVGT